MSDWGGTDAESLKKWVNSIFLKDGKIPMTNYETKLVSLTTDGASVNTGKISGLMTRFALERDWLVQIHCINHRVELAIKNALKESKFKDIDNFYQSLTMKEYQDISLKVITTVQKIRTGNWRTTSLSKLSSPLT